LLFAAIDLLLRAVLRGRSEIKEDPPDPRARTGGAPRDPKRTHRKDP
jgi:hypothetical protein